MLHRVFDHHLRLRRATAPSTTRNSYLAEVAGRRFEFYGFPLRLEVACGSPVRAVGIVED